MTIGSVKTIPFDTAQTFLDALAPEKWGQANAWAPGWIFRGQRDAAWDLTPSALRSNDDPSIRRLREVCWREYDSWGDKVAIDFQGRHKVGDKGDNYARAFAQARAEVELLAEFLEFADQVGHTFEGVEQIRAMKDFPWQRFSEHFPANFIPDPSPAIALAQHHGIPTRFIDFTRSPLVAAYFAVSEVKPQDTSGCIAVWALSKSRLAPRSIHFANGDAAMRALPDNRQFAIYEIPKGWNGYLSAQDGLFVYPRSACAFFAENRKWPRLEDLLLSSLGGNTDGPDLQKITLPWSEAGELVRLLWLRGVSRAQLMPTLDNVTAGLHSKWRWTPVKTLHTDPHSGLAKNPWL